MDCRLTNEDFQVFRSEFGYWVDVLGLRHWDLSFVQRPNRNSTAWVSWRIPGFVASVCLARTWLNRASPITEADLSKLALHEALELLFAPLGLVADERFSSRAEMDRERHAIITVLEQVIANAKEKPPT